MSHSSMVSFDDVRVAAERLQGVSNPTPVLTSRTMNERTGAHAFFKAENFQRSGSFKFRGAYNALSQLDSSTKEVVTFSSGNHAQAIALVGLLLDIKSTIIMPFDCSDVKRAAMFGYGAEVFPRDIAPSNRETEAHRMASGRNLPVIPPYDHPHIIAGQATVALEFLQDHPDLDILLVPCGGGGLLSGCSLAASALCPELKVIGVEPKGADDAARSFKTGVLQTVKNPKTMADGARTPSLGKLPFQIIKEFTHDIITVTDHALAYAMDFLLERMKILVEPTGALGAAALLMKEVDVEGKKVGVILSGGNVDLNKFRG